MKEGVPAKKFAFQDGIIIWTRGGIPEKNRINLH